MIGQTKLPKWRYDFNCRQCARQKYVKDEIRDGIYCTVLMTGEDPMHADDDRVVRCDYYQKEVRK